MATELMSLLHQHHLRTGVCRRDRGCHAGGTAAGDEDIRVRIWPAERAIEAVLAGRVSNSVAAIGLLWLAVRRTALREEWSKA